MPPPVKLYQITKIYQKHELRLGVIKFTNHNAKKEARPSQTFHFLFKTNFDTDLDNIHSLLLSFLANLHF